MNLLGYARTSTEAQSKGFGLDIQVDAIKKYAKREGIKNVRIFRDKGVSGALQERAGLMELLSFLDENEGHFCVVFLRLDRLARDLLVQENILLDFKRRNVDVVSIEEPDLCSNDPTRKLFRQMKGMMAEYEKSMICRRMSSGRLKKVSSGGGYAGGNTCFGFDVQNGHYTPTPNEIAIVKEIFKLRRKRPKGKPMSYQRIADALNDRSIPPPSGRAWYAMSVRYIYKNKFYKGFQHYGEASYFHQNLKII